MLAAQAVATGDSEIVVAGGQENMSASAHVLLGSRDGQRMGDWKMIDSMIVDGLWDVYNQYHMGITAENVARQEGITRDMQDALALASQQKAAAAQAAGKFKDEIVPVSIPQRKGDPVVFATDEFINTKTSAEALAGLRPAFDKAGSVTAGNASGINDGAAAVVVMSAKKAAALGLKPLARIVSYATSGLDPATMGLGPVPASQKALQRAGWKVGDVDLFELNEAFAAQACAVNKLAGGRSGQGQRQRRRHRHRPPHRCQRLPHPGDAAARDAAQRREEGPGRSVHRRRHGRGDGAGARLSMCPARAAGVNPGVRPPAL
jgi:acetyl-CoA C-acetyltransferase